LESSTFEVIDFTLGAQEFKRVADMMMFVLLELEMTCWVMHEKGTIIKQGGVSHLQLCHQHKKKYYLKAKEEEELWKLKYFTMQKLYNLQKNPLKTNQNASRCLL
jgi:hypothetical protein